MILRAKCLLRAHLDVSPVGSWRQVGTSPHGPGGTVPVAHIGISQEQVLIAGLPVKRLPKDALTCLVGNFDYLEGSSVIKTEITKFTFLIPDSNEAGEHG